MTPSPPVQPGFTPLGALGCSKDKRRKLANRFKDAKVPFRIVIVREGEAPRRSWLTGFDAPCLHTMYADKPMQGYGRRMSNEQFRMSN